MDRNTQNHLKSFTRLPKLLFLILLLFFLKQLFLVFLIPPWEAPDETAHIAYVMYLYNQQDFPSIAKPFLPVSIEQSIQDNRNILKQFKTQTAINKEQGELFDRFDNRYAAKTPNVASHPPLYYISLLPLYYLSLYLPSYWTIILLRLGSVFLSIGCLFLIYQLVRRVHVGDNILPLFVVVLVGLQPMFSFISSIVNNDILVVLFYLLIILRSIEVVTTSKRTLKSVVIDGLLLGASTLVKPQLFIGCILYVSAVIIKRISLKLAVTALATALLVSGLWYVRQFGLEGTNMISYAVQNIQPTPESIWWYPLEFFKGKQHVGIFMSFWGFFGWLDVPMRQPIYLLFMLFITFGLYGLWHGRKQLTQILIRSRVYWLLIIAFISYGLAIVVFDIQSFVLSHQFLIQGRYLAPILPLFIFFLVHGLWLIDKKYCRTVQLLSLTIFLITQLFMIITISHAYYGTFIPQLPLLRIYAF